MSGPKFSERYVRMRTIALAARPEELKVDVEPNELFGIGRDEPNGVVMERGIPEGVATLVATLAGGARLLLSNGRTISAGANSFPVRDAALELLASCRAAIPFMEVTDSFPYPDIGRVRFYVLTKAAAYTCEGDPNTLTAAPDPLARLFDSGEATLKALHQAREEQRKQEP